ncbi:hypothetical protein [Pseudomonas costantinii]|uniref:Uncharacterized protein n=1 Tax=Pseudomonas costantinii TaxID=168469 RepID=A0A1S2UDB2_9PSED|nr:hypothetical protein [Pseudomonas costantinii]NVZ18210.1 hypothetical protein [Pseudomonas costantinii]OIN43898.1 hypothetical protein BFL40_31075 [Pseudomonas costantinii]SEE25872.1 hypothetical protein SAMN04515675_4653 [Pseudomonas costantinii]
MTLIEKPSRLPVAIGDALKSAFPQLRVGNHQDFKNTGDKTGVLITVEGNGPGIRSLEGRKAHALSVSLKATVADGSAPFEACDLASQLMDLALDNRWGLPADQCDLPAALVAAPSIQTGAEMDYDTWTVSFTQTLYLGPSLLEDPTGTPLFACTWEVSNINDPNQYRPLQE